MKQYCNCPISFNITVGVFLLAVPTASWFGLWGIALPLWLELLMAIMGVATIWLNTANRANVHANNLSTEEANRLHAEEGF